MANQGSKEETTCTESGRGVLRSDEMRPDRKKTTCLLSLSTTQPMASPVHVCTSRDRHQPSALVAHRVTAPDIRPNPPPSLLTGHFVHLCGVVIAEGHLRVPS